MSSAVVKTAPTKAPPVCLGPLSGGGQALTSFRPTVLQVADRINDALTLETAVETALPLPEGMELQMCEANSQVQLRLKTRVFSLRMRKVFGFVGQIELKEKSEGTVPSPSTYLFLCFTLENLGGPLPPSPNFGSGHLFDPCSAANYCTGTVAIRKFPERARKQLFALPH